MPEFHFRQYLFASQARVLLKLRRPVDVAERGLHFVQVGAPADAGLGAAPLWPCVTAWLGCARH